MRFSKLLQALPLASSAFGLSRRDLGNSADTTVENTKKFIVEVTPGADVDALSAKLTSQGARVMRTFKSDVFSGLSLETEIDNIDTLQEVVEVAQAWPNSQITISPLEPSSVFDTDISASNYSVHESTGVDKLHAAGIFGKGATVAVVDTGIDYNHPALGGGFGPGFKISGGWDLVGDGSWPSSGSKVPDADPMDYHGHGTHVAGILAGKSEWFTGVAPEANILAYKVMTKTGGVDDDTLLDAFLMAYESKADIITSSIGGPGGWSWGVWATVASRIAEKGVLVTISGGNSGKIGPFYADSGSSGKEVLSVASAEGGELPGTPFHITYNLDGESKTDLAAYTYFRDQWDIVDWPIYPVSFNTTDSAQACSAITGDDLPDLSEKITLVRRSTECDFLAQEWNLRAAYKSSRVMYYNDDQKPVQPWSWLADWPKAFVDKAVGEAIIEVIKAGGSVTANFTPSSDYNQYVGMFNSVGSRPNYYTSWGGLYDLELKPDVAAPGGEIFSTIMGGGYGTKSGTSMACPYVAGVAALYIGQYGGRDVHGEGFGGMLRNRIVSSGAAMPWSIVDGSAPVNTGFWAPTPQAGSGLVNAWKVLNYTTELSVRKFNLNDTSHFSRYHSVEVKNNAKVPVTYTFSVQHAAGIEAKSPAREGVGVLTDLSPIKMEAAVSLPSGTFKVQPGQSKTAQFNFDYPKGLNGSQLPVYSGKILISGSNHEELSIPYFGAGFSLKKEFDTVFETGSVYGRISNGVNFLNHTSFTFDVAKYGSPTSQDYPRLYASFSWGCSELRWDIFEPSYKERSWTYPPVIGQSGYVGAAAIFRNSDYASSVTPDSDIEDTVAMPRRDISRTTPLGQTQHAFFWLGKLGNGSYIAPGNYSMRFAALRPFGTPQHSDNWDIWETPVITVLPKPAS